MKILSVIAQKPSSTGSGVYLTELVRCFSEMGHIQEVVCACYEEDIVRDEQNIHYNKIIFNTATIPFYIAGMSDVMPYKSIKYSDFVENGVNLLIWEKVFIEKIIEVVIRFKPDVIVCHHLYLLTAIIVDLFSNYDDGIVCEFKNIFSNLICSFNDLIRNDNYKPLIYGICHNTDLRQYRQTNLKRNYIKENIAKLDKVFFPSLEHLNIAKDLYGIKDNKMQVVGIGYNNKIFHKMNVNNDRDECKINNKTILYVGKVAKKKGVLSLIKAVNRLEDSEIILDIVGGKGDINEYNEIFAFSQKTKSKINFIEPMSQEKLAIQYNNHNVFVLSSFSEGIPMVPIEAMACGAKVVISDLPGVKDFYDANIKNASIKYVKLPKLTNVDDSDEKELDEFEERLASAIKESICDETNYKPVLTDISWENIANKIIGE